MLDLEFTCMISAQRVMCVKKYVENYESPWKYVFNFYPRKWVGNFCFNATLIIEHYPLLFLSSTESVCEPGLR